MTAATGPAPRSTDAVAPRQRNVGWAMALRGVVAVIFGLIALRYPSAAAGAFVIVFAVFAFADAILEFITARALGRMGKRWGWYVFGALVSIAAGVVALAYPRATFVVLVLLVAARAILTGIVEMGAAISWRELDARWLLGILGALSIVFGILLLVSPVRGGLALLWTIGVYAIVVGVVGFVSGLRLAARGDHGYASRHAPST